MKARHINTMAKIIVPETSEEKAKILQDWMKGQGCVFCTFTIDLIEDIVETEAGYAHRECAKDDTEKLSEENNQKLI